jgi:hypothetical protein
MWVASLLDNGVWPVSSLSPNGYRVRIASIVERHTNGHSVMAEGRGEVPLRVPNSFPQRVPGVGRHATGALAAPRREMIGKDIFIFLYIKSL